MNEIILSGCRTEPLSSYLKALGIFRILGEQRDAALRAFWNENRFVIRTVLTKEEIVSFLLHDYAPTPIVAPWNGGSGFYQGDEKKGFDAIRKSSSARFDSYKTVINEIASWSEMPKNYETLFEITDTLAKAIAAKREGKARNELIALLDGIEQGISDTAELLGDRIGPQTELAKIERLPNKFKNPDKKRVSALWSAVKKGRTQCVKLERSVGKEQLLPFARSRLSEAALSWLDAVFVLKADNKAVYNPVLGTGGNEGRLDFTNNFMQRVVELFIECAEDDAKKMLESSLFSEPVDGLWTASVGQYDPGRAGGFNQGAEVETKNFKINPWDFILMLEGTPFLAGAISKRQESDAHGWGALPFTVRHSGVGFSSSEHSESGRAETWMPIWGNPAGICELRQLFSEGRASLGKRPAANGIDFARCLSSLGVDRGIEGFVRYTFLERRGTNYVALPAGRHDVVYDPRVKILDDLDPILQKLDRFLRKFSNLPATFGSARRRIDEAIYDCAVSASPQKFVNLVRALGRMERLVALRDRTKDPNLARPLVGLRPHWIDACDTGEVEVRIAAALASIHGSNEVGPIRSNLAGVDPSAPWKWAQGHGQKKWIGNTLVERLTGVLVQRMMDAERHSLSHAPLAGSLPIRSRDVVPFLHGETDDACIEELLWGFGLVRRQRGESALIRERWNTPLTSAPIPRDWALMKLLFLPGAFQGVNLPIPSRLLFLLAAGRSAEAVAQGVRRLKNAELHPLPVVGSELDAGRLAAGLMIPVSDPKQLGYLVLKKEKQTT